MRTWDEGGGPHHRRGGGRKSFAIMAKPTKRSWRYRLGLGRDWFVWGRYLTARDRDEAMTAVTKNTHNRECYEFRAAPTEETKP